MAACMEESQECVAERFLRIELKLSQDLSSLQFFSPVYCIYNPLNYAWPPHQDYVMKYCQQTKNILFVGMNPGPFGMAQNGVPFGDPKYVTEWLHITGQVEKPPVEHPNRPILGFNSTRSEVSGSRFWGFISKYSLTPQNFFSNCFVHNYCPLVFMNENGKNITPNNIPAIQRQELFRLCDNALIEVIKLLQVQIIVCIGKFVESRCRTLFKDSTIQVCGLMHPSPANPMANANWENIALKQLQETGLMQYITPQ